MTEKSGAGARVWQRWLQCFCCLLLGLPALAQGQLAPASIDCGDPTRSLLWRVSDDEGRLMHLFGSIHVGREDFYPLHPDIEGPFQAADGLVFEVDPSAVDNPAMMLQLQQRGMLPAGQSLDDMVSGELVGRLQSVLEEMGLPVQAMMGMRPWFLTLVLTGMQISLEGYDPAHGVENYFLGIKPASMPVLELESLEEQIGFLEELDAETFLTFTVQGLEEGSDEIDRLIQAWQCADHEALSQMMFDDLLDVSPQAQADMERLRDRLFHQRNQSMSVGLQALLEEGPGSLFVVVGSGHLVGEGSIVDLLQEAGYQVEAVTLDAH